MNPCIYNGVYSAFMSSIFVSSKTLIVARVRQHGIQITVEIILYSKDITYTGEILHRNCLIKYYLVLYRMMKCKICRKLFAV